MNDLPDEDKLKYFRGMITEEEKLDMGQAYYEDGLRDGVEKGIQQGIEKGIEKGIQQAIHGMIRMGLAPEDIATALEIPVEKVLALSAKTEG